MWSCVLLSCWAALPPISCRRHRERMVSFFIAPQTHFTFEAKNKTRMNKQLFLIFWCLHKDPFTVPRRNVKTQLYLLRLVSTIHTSPWRKLSVSKTLVKQEDLKTPAFRFSVDRKRSFPKTIASCDSVSLTEFSPNTNPKWPVIVAFSAFSGVDRRQNETFIVKILWRCLDSALSFHFIICVLKWLWRQDHLRECLQAVDFGLTLRIN